MPVIHTRSDIRPLPYHAVRTRSTTLLVVLLQMLAAAAAVAAQSPASRDLFDDLFARTLVKRQSIQSIRARFTETTVSSLLAKPLVARGTVIAAPPARVLMTYEAPERRVVLIDGKSLNVTWPDRGERESIDIARMQKRIDQYFAQATVKQLREMFDIAAELDPVLRDTYRVDMRPKRKQIRQGLEGLQLWIARDTLMLAQMRMSFPGGDTKTIRLEDLAVNVPIADETFRVPR